jgi:predicted RNA-binding Zn-ribbon protein involved in translation (DUF1610 family)
MKKTKKILSICPSCGAKAKVKDIEYLGDQSYSCPNCKDLPRCDRCDKLAVYNLENIWELYMIDKKGGYKKADSWEGSENNNYCEECYNKEMNN